MEKFIYPISFENQKQFQKHYDDSVYQGVMIPVCVDEGELYYQPLSQLISADDTTYQTFNHPFSTLSLRQPLDQYVKQLSIDRQKSKVFLSISSIPNRFASSIVDGIHYSNFLYRLNDMSEICPNLVVMNALDRRYYDYPEMLNETLLDVYLYIPGVQTGQVIRNLPDPERTTSHYMTPLYYKPEFLDQCQKQGYGMVFYPGYFDQLESLRYAWERRTEDTEIVIATKHVDDVKQKILTK